MGTALSKTTERGYGWDWQKRRNWFVAHNPVCVDPLNRHPDRITPAEHVDHIVPFAKGGARLDVSNLRAVCRACHQALTARGNPV
ncbi:MAG TPA: HNH endonuclease signature motif containing protein [Phycisphaerae bacterium]|nr:HNH endonuclease signature motif containing protein [Phycisphaerae bacterium]